MKNISRRQFLEAAGLTVAAAALTACGGSSSSTAASTGASNAGSTPAGGGVPDLSGYKLCIGEVQTDDRAQIRVEYFQNYIKSRYGTDFMITEKIEDGDSEMTNIENAAMAGCDAFVSYQNQYMLASCQKAQSEGIMYCANSVPNAGGAPDCIAANLPNYIGCFGQNQPGTGALIRDYLAENASADGAEGFLFITGIASRNNQQHTQVTLQSLQALVELYGLEFDAIKDGTYADLTALAQTDQPGEYTNNKGVNIYILPGLWTADTWLPTLSPALQSGKYGWIISCDASFTACAQVMQDVESSMNMNIRYVCVSGINDSLVSTMNTIDPSGNPTIDFVACGLQTITDGSAYALAMNSLTGYQDKMRKADGTMGSLLSPRVGISNSDELAELSDWDMLATKKWAGSYKYIDSMLSVNNPEQTIDDIQSFLDTLVTVDSLHAMDD